MKMKYLIQILAVFIAAFLILLMCIPVIAFSLEQDNREPIVTIMEFQTYLQEQGHELSADGKLGPETQRAWEEQIWNQENEEFNK